MISFKLSAAILGLYFSHAFAKVFWSRRSHASVITDNWIYIDGGDVAYSANAVSGKWSYDRENITYGIDLSKDWDNSTLILVQTMRPAEAVALLGESLWFDNKNNSVYCFGGMRSYATPALNGLAPPFESIWGFKQNDEGRAHWYQVIGPVSTTPFPPNIHRNAYGMSASDGNRAYHLGGFLSWETSSSITDRLSSSGILNFEFNTLTITNLSDAGYLSPQTGIDRPRGAMINIPMFGDDGILAILPSGSDRQNFAFNNITLYDKKEEKWYSQIASGDIPQPRSWFCAVGVEGDQKISFEIFIHGGVINNEWGSQTPNSDHVYILSLPSFRWFRANYTSSHSRGAHTCHVKNSQIIMIGGQDPTYSGASIEDVDAKQAPADPWLQGIGVFDMKALRFKDSYEAKASPYETPDFIKKYYGTAGNQYPSSWTSGAVKELFEVKSKNLPNTTNASSSAVPAANTSNPSSSAVTSARSRQLSHGALAGIVVGCTAFIVICAVGATFTMKRKENKRIKSAELSGRLSPRMLPSEPQFIELSAEQRAREMLSERQDRVELSCTSRIFRAELGSSTPIGQELRG